jgi:ectoine hydroxylase-related dioxygenase (phytanoyl-CoA dioxygenase family)
MAANDIETIARLSEQQVRFFETFGFLKLPGLFRDEVEEISEAFGEVFATEGHPRMVTHVELHGEERRVIIPQFVTKHPRLDALRADPRVVGIVTSLLGPDHEYAESDGNLFDCESHWHSDTYGAPMLIHHVKLSFYLDDLRADSGAIRVIPGSHHFKETFATDLRRGFREPSEIADHFGVDARDIPSVAVETRPGDVVVWDFRSVHASYYGQTGRRLFSINYRERSAEPAA